MRDEQNGGPGAKFTVYLSPANETATYVTSWSVTVAHQGGSWSATVTSRDASPVIQSPQLSGTFTVSVIASGPQLESQQLSGDQGDTIECTDQTQVMIGIVAAQGGYGASYWINELAPLPIHP